MNKLLIEIGVEELPARFIKPALDQFCNILSEKLINERITYGQVDSYCTPRRLAILINDVADKQPDITQEIKGPAKSISYQEGQPTKAALGFARSQGVAAEELMIKKKNGNEYVFAKKSIKGKLSIEVLEQIIPQAITALGFPKNMRWGKSDLKFARPLRWIVALFNDQVINFVLENIKSGNKSFGHRQLSHGKITITHAGDYLENLRHGYVIADHKQRKLMISNQVHQLAKQVGGKVQEDEDLLDEVTNLVEYPTAFIGSFEPDYLQVPSEVLITTMKEHQRYFPVFNQENKLLPSFIGVRNGADNQLDSVISGNEKVLRARFADARFFFDEDRKKSLDRYVEGLKVVVYQEGLGTIYDKVNRITDIAKSLCKLLDLDIETKVVLRTAHLAKADLVTNMVNEFPELQGVMGSTYALLSGEEQLVAAGIADHYKPRFANDDLPQSKTGIIVGIADKIDTLVGYFGLGKLPTGSHDPFALRRQALGIVEILLVNDISIGLGQLIDLACDSYGSIFTSKLDEIKTALLNFIAGRLRIVLLDKGYRYDSIDAVFAQGMIVIPSIVAKISALDQVRSEKEFNDIYTVYERCANLASKQVEININTELFTEKEHVLYDMVQSLNNKMITLFNNGEYVSGLRLLAKLRKPVDQLFDSVMIMDKDIHVRQNRLSLLQKIVDLFNEYADFGLIVMDM